MNQCEATYVNHIVAGEGFANWGEAGRVIEPASQESDLRAVYVMKLTARGFVGEGTDFIDLGRAAIVRGFAELTTAEMHSVWKRRV